MCRCPIGRVRYEHEADGSLSLRIGLGYAKGMRRQAAEALVGARAAEGRFRRRRIWHCGCRR